MPELVLDEIVKILAPAAKAEVGQRWRAASRRLLPRPGGDPPQVPATRDVERRAELRSELIAERCQQIRLDRGRAEEPPEGPTMIPVVELPRSDRAEHDRFGAEVGGNIRGGLGLAALLR